MLFSSNSPCFSPFRTIDRIRAEAKQNNSVGMSGNDKADIAATKVNARSRQECLHELTPVKGVNILVYSFFEMCTVACVLLIHERVGI